MGTLNERYNQGLLDEADARRTKLAHGRLTVGPRNSPRVERVLEILYQTHQSHYFGHFESVGMTAGALLEQSLMLVLEERMRAGERVTVTEGAGRVRVLHSPWELGEVGLGQLLGAAKHYQMFGRDFHVTAELLRTARNALIHAELPDFEESGINWKAVIENDGGGRPIRTEYLLAKVEVEARTLTVESRELWAYFFLTRTRDLVGELFKARAPGV